MNILPYDPTGEASSNRIEGEIHVVNKPNVITDASFIVLRYTPFFKDRLVVKHGTRVLLEGVDFTLIFHHDSLSKILTKEIYGGIAFRNYDFTGTIKVSYQGVGGDFQLPDISILEDLSRRQGNLQYVTFDQLVGTPSSYPPQEHLHEFNSDLVNMGEMLDVLANIAQAIGQRPASLAEINQRVSHHLEAPNAHTKSAVGLSKLENLSAATPDDIENENTERKYITTDTLDGYIAQVMSGINVQATITEAQIAAITQSVLDSEALGTYISDAIQVHNNDSTAHGDILTKYTDLINAHNSLVDTVNNLSDEIDGTAPAPSPAPTPTPTPTPDPTGYIPKITVTLLHTGPIENGDDVRIKLTENSTPSEIAAYGYNSVTGWFTTRYATKLGISAESSEYGYKKDVTVPLGGEVIVTTRFTSDRDDWKILYAGLTRIQDVNNKNAIGTFDVTITKQVVEPIYLPDYEVVKTSEEPMYSGGKRVIVLRDKNWFPNGSTTPVKPDALRYPYINLEVYVDISYENSTTGDSEVFMTNKRLTSRVTDGTFTYKPAIGNAVTEVYDTMVLNFSFGDSKLFGDTSLDDILFKTPIEEYAVGYFGHISRLEFNAVISPGNAYPDDLDSLNIRLHSFRDVPNSLSWDVKPSTIEFSINEFDRYKTFTAILPDWYRPDLHRVGFSTLGHTQLSKPARLVIDCDAAIYTDISAKVRRVGDRYQVETQMSAVAKDLPAGPSITDSYDVEYDFGITIYGWGSLRVAKEESQLIN